LEARKDSVGSVIGVGVAYTLPNAIWEREKLYLSRGATSKGMGISKI